jgi:hypothetical protein
MRLAFKESERSIAATKASQIFPWPDVLRAADSILSLFQDRIAASEAKAERFTNLADERAEIMGDQFASLTAAKARIEELTEALRPFGLEIHPSHTDDGAPFRAYFTVGEIRRARSALDGEPGRLTEVGDQLCKRAEEALAAYHGGIMSRGALAHALMVLQRETVAWRGLRSTQAASK